MDGKGKNLYKDMFVIGFALFSMFFGAGNVIFPPFLGMEAGPEWFRGFVFYYLADIGLALVAIFAMLKCNSDVDGITKRAGKIPSILLSSAMVLCVGPLLAIPRTAATTYEMTIVPLLGNVNSIIFSIIFFALILLLCINESSVVDIVGKILTPALFIGLLILIFRGVAVPMGVIAAEPKIDNVISSGVISGYQTMDVLAALIFGIIILKTAKAKGYRSRKEKFNVIGGAGVIAAVGLLIVYCGLTYLGATASMLFDSSVNRSVLLVTIIQSILGQVGIVVLGVVVALACITTAVALVSSSATFFARLSNGKVNYRVLVAVICTFSAVVSNVGLDMIVSISVPILNIVYPAALTLIILSFFGKKIQNDNIFKFATFGAILTSLLETFKFGAIGVLPLANMGFAWITPAIVFGIIGFFIKSKTSINLEEFYADDEFDEEDLKVDS